MIRIYIKNAVEANDKRFLPKHPHFSRSFETSDGESVCAASYEDTPYDVVIEVPCVSFTSRLKAGEKPQKMQASPSSSNLAAASVGARFVQAFAAAGKQKDMPAEPAEPAVPAQPAQPAQPAPEK